MRFRSVLSLAALAVLAAGCTQTATWSKEGVSDEDVQRAMVDCRRQADAQAERESFRSPSRTPVYEVDPSTGQLREVFRTERQSADLAEKTRSQELYRRCMTARGYHQT